MKNTASYKRVNKPQPNNNLNIREENVDGNGGEVGDIT